ncbi:MAG: arginase family protein [Oligoflexales bacterium]
MGVKKHTPLFLFDVPSNAGCLEVGTDLFAKHLRTSGIKELIAATGRRVEDLGAIQCNDLPRHNIPPIRNYPSPKIVWERSSRFIKDHGDSLKGGIGICLGGDCSIVVGTATGFAELWGPENVHIIYIDGDVDSMKPDPSKCAGSAGMGLWFLTQKSEYWNGATIDPKQITVIGNKEPPTTDVGIPFIPLTEIMENDIQTCTNRILANIPQSKVFVHFDVDVICQEEMPASYAPREKGLTFAQTEILLKTVCSDPRVKFFEITEFMPNKDPNGYLGKKISTLMASCMLGI